MNLKLKDQKEIIFIIIFSSILVGYYINFNMNLGIYCSDVYVYLLNALYFTGTNVHSTYNVYLSPIICFLTSILFRLGLVDRLAIYIVTGILAILGNVGMYLLLKTRFNNLLSLTGTIIYSTLALNLTWLANGSLDVAGACISIWTILFTIWAMKNPKYYRVIFVLFVIGFFTRFNLGLILPVMVLCYSLYKNIFKMDKEDSKYIKQGIGLGILAALIILVPVYIMADGYLGFVVDTVHGATGSLGSAKDAAYNTDITYYLVNFANFISASRTVFVMQTPTLENPTILSGLIFLILGIGGVLWAKKYEFKYDKEKIIGIILLLIGLVTFNQFSAYFTIIIVLFGLFLIGRNSENKEGLLMAGWMLANFIFFSYYIIKVNRYIITTFPAFTYFLMIALEEINEKINRKNILPVILIVLFIIQGFAFTLTFEDTNGYYMGPQEISEYIISNNDNWTNLTIGVYNMRPFYWYLGGDVIAISDNDIELIENSTLDYYISHKPLNLTNYTEVTNIDGTYLYERINY